MGEAPGADEDRIGRPFVGRSGQLLDTILGAIHLDRTNVYIANVVPWRPPGNRTPTPQEIALCKPFLMRQIELVNPDFIVCLGGPAAHTLLQTTEGILKLRGRWFSHQSRNKTIQVLPTLHPAYLLRQPLQKRLIWRDMRNLKRAFQERGSDALG
jgi:uracil-DNA glycosylase